jgi:hypothetical protein
MMGMHRKCVRKLTGENWRLPEPERPGCVGFVTICVAQKKLQLA